MELLEDSALNVNSMSTIQLKSVFGKFSLVDLSREFAKSICHACFTCPLH